MEREYRSFLDCIKDPELKRKLTPDYNLGCTRIPKSDRNYYEAVQLPNAHIVKGEIARIVPDGVVMADGTKVALDVLVYATGFDVHAYMRPMAVTGLDGTAIAEAWKEKIYSYGGIALPGFPNLFMLYGPFAPVNNVPVPLGLDQEIACIMRLIGEARARRAAVAPTAAATEKFLARLAAAFPDTVWVGGCKTGTPAGSPTRCCGRFRRASTRHFSRRCRPRTSSSSRPGRGTDPQSAWRSASAADASDPQYSSKPRRHIREERIEPLCHRRMRENGVAEPWVGQARQHRRLHRGHDLTGLSANHRKAEDAVVTPADKHLHKALCFVGRRRPPNASHRQPCDPHGHILALCFALAQPDASQWRLSEHAVRDQPIARAAVPSGKIVPDDPKVVD